MPLAMMLLVQHVSGRACPPQFRCRQILPTSGTVSTSVWDCAVDAAALKEHLDDVLNANALPNDPTYWCARLLSL